MNLKNRDTPSFLNKYLKKDTNPKRPFEFQVKTQEKQDVSPLEKQARRKTIEQNFSSLADQSIRKCTILPNYEPSKCSSGRNGIIKAYAANTNQGLIRDYNEDRVSIILNIVKPQNRANENWPKCSFFGVYDGHGGSTCADFLRDNLHQFVIKESEFPWNPIAAIKKGFEAAETHFLAYALNSFQKGIPERSGSCAIVCLVVGEVCYVANVGDSRAVMSSQKGKKVTNLSIDHKPETEIERIQKGGGKIYQTHGMNEEGEQIIGPIRVMPGRLSVSRTFGDIEAKLEQFGGNSRVVISEPEIKIIKLNQEHDFIVMGCDGIFDKLSSEEVIDIIWQDLRNNDKLNLHSLLSQSVDSVLKEAIFKKSSDNITLLIVAFQVNQTKEELKEFRYTISNSVDRIEDSSYINNRPRLSQQMQNRSDENYSGLINQHINNQSTSFINNNHNNKLNMSINLQGRLFRQLQSKKNIQDETKSKTKHSYIL
ncbi:unnamed protein product [Paramecium pentaurelia]|uniref:protein-serine/threonine phosphatase n=1 Tax=Paramecium pentaurelia TaxID=43138 RepID=A0A8S1SZK1_9CILI|nr:unnamed protein product [Paramecium pentaurelia]